MLQFRLVSMLTLVPEYKTGKSKMATNFKNECCLMTISSMWLTQLMGRNKFSVDCKIWQTYEYL